VIGFLIGLIDPISRIVGQIAVARTEMAKAATDQERIHAQERVDTLEARKAVLIAESGSRVNGLIRAGFALPFVIYNIKLVLWDKIVMAGQATTDPLSAELYQVELACIGFYFLYEVTARLRR
jgi:hypothetical protein